MIEIKISVDFVVVEGVRIDRPSRIARSVWRDFWELAVAGQLDWDRAEFLLGMGGGF